MLARLSQDPTMTGRRVLQPLLCTTIRSLLILVSCKFDYKNRDYVCPVSVSESTPECHKQR